MMRGLLAFETSSPLGGVALRTSDGRIQEVSWRDQRQHGTRMPTVARELVDAAGLQLEDVEGVAVGLGPGSFTGARVGVTFAKTLSWSIGRPLFGVCGLAARALAAHEEGDPVGASAPRIHAIARAHEGALYAGIWRPDHRLLLVAESDAALVEDTEFLAGLAPEDRVVMDPELATAFGPLDATVVPLEAGVPVAGIARLATARMDAEEEGDDVDTLEPLYLQAAAPER